MVAKNEQGSVPSLCESIMDVWLKSQIDKEIQGLQRNLYTNPSHDS